MSKLKYILSFSIFFLTIIVFAQKSNADTVLKTIRNISKKDVAKAIQYGDSIIELDIYDDAGIYEQLGWYHIRLHEYKASINNFEKAKVSYEKSLDNKNLSAVLLGLGKANSSIKQKDKAIQYITQAQQIAIKMKDTNIIAYSYRALSHLYYEYDDFESAIKYSKKGQKIQLILADTIAVNTSYIDLAVFFEHARQLDSALFYNKKALQLSKLLKQPYETSITYNNIARIAQQTKNYSLAIENYQKSIALHDEHHTDSSIPCTNIASVYLKKGKYQLAKKYYQKALLQVLKSKNSTKEKEIYDQLLTLSILEQDFEKALKYQKDTDSLNNLNIIEENNEKLRLITNQYAQLKEKEALQQKIIVNKKNKIIFVSLASFLLLLGVYFYQRNRNSKLVLEQDKLMLEQKVLRTQMNPHFIFNALTAIQNTIFDGDPIKSSSYVSKFSKLIRQNFEFINKKEITLAEDLDALKNYIETQQMRFENQFEYHFEIDKSVSTSKIKIPPMLLQPFVENAIEHGLRPKEEKGNLYLKISKGLNGYLCIYISDDGIGYQTKVHEDNRTHAITILKTRLKLRGLKEEKLFKIEKINKNGGTLVTLKLKVKYD